MPGGIASPFSGWLHIRSISGTLYPQAPCYSNRGHKQLQIRQQVTAVPGEKFTTQLKALIRAQDERKARAHARLADPSAKWWSFGILEFSMVPDEFRIDTVAVIRRVHEPPGSFELANALNDKTLVPGIDRYSIGLT